MTEEQTEPETMWFVLEVNPEPWRIGPLGTKRAGKRVVPIVGRDTQGFAYKASIIEEITPKLDPLWTPHQGRFVLEFLFWRNRADYETPQARTHRKHEADVTNMQKLTEDALQGILFKNDKDTASITSSVVAQGPDVPGLVVIGFTPLPEDFVASFSWVPAEVQKEIIAGLSAKVDPLDSNAWGEENNDF